MQVFVGRCRVPDVELNRLAYADQVGDGQRAAVLIDTEHVANEKIAALEFVLVLIDDAADMQTMLKELLIFGLQFRVDLLQVKKRRPAAQLQNDVFLGLGDDQAAARPSGQPSKLYPSEVCSNVR